MAGYSQTPLLKKLGIKDGGSLLICNPPIKLPQELKDLATTAHAGKFDVVILFADSLALFRTEFGELMQAIHADGAIWTAWPKKASGVKTDLTENAIRDLALTTHFVDVKVCAIDETWSGLKLVIRKELRKSLDKQTDSSI